MLPTRYKKTILKLTALKLHELFVILSIATIMCQHSASAQTLEAPLEKSEINLTPEEKQWIADHTEILVSNSAKWPPIDFISAGQPTGFAVEYMTLIASKVGLRVRFISGPEWENTIQKLRDRELDIINTLSFTEERAEYFSFTPSYIDLPVVHYGRIGSPNINTPKDLEGKRIGIQDEHKIALTYQGNYPDLNYVIFEDSISALQALSSGEIDIFTDDRETIEYSISQYNIPGLAEIEGAFSFEIQNLDQRFAVHKDNQILFSVINKGMAAVTAQEYNNISQRWISPRSRSMSNLLTSEERMWLSQNNRIRVVVDPTSAPFEFIDEEGEFAGVSAAYLKDIAEQLNVEFIWANNSAWNDGLNMIRSGTADLVSSIAPNEERAEYLIFSEPYFAAPLVIYSKTDGINYNSLASLNNQSVALIRDYAINALVRTDYPDIQIKEYNNISEVLNAVSNGEAEAYIGSIPVTNYALAENSIENIQITGTTQYTLPSTIGVRSDLPLLASAIDKAVRNIPNISRQTYLTEWLTTVVNPTVVDYGPIWNVVGFSLLAGIAFTFWNRKLSREIKRRIIIESQLQKASAAKSDFLASMSHELRTPLNAIIGFSETIKAEIFGPLNNKKYTEYNNSIHDSGKYLLGLVEEILDLSTLEAKKREVTFETVEIADLINDCELLIRGQAEEKNIDLIINNTDTPFKVTTDNKALKQILINLLTNAIKFTPNNGRVSVSYGSQKDNFLLKVTDTGYGISEEDIKIITNPFTQANVSPYVSQGEGTGLGLAIVKSLVDLLNGKLKFESRLGNGTIATVSIPLQHNSNMHNP